MPVGSSVDPLVNSTGADNPDTNIGPPFGTYWFPRQAGASVALGISVQFATGALASLWVSHLADGSAWPMCLVVGCCGLGALVAYGVTLRLPARAVAVTA